MQWSWCILQPELWRMQWQLTHWGDSKRCGLEYGRVRNEHPITCQTATTRRRLLKLSRQSRNKRLWLINLLYDMKIYCIILQLLVVPIKHVWFMNPWSSRIRCRDSSPLKCQFRTLCKALATASGAFDMLPCNDVPWCTDVQSTRLPGLPKSEILIC